MISRIEIQYFRSIYRASLTRVDSMNVITGKNDVGKSNVLKAINLFFNNCIVEDGDYSFMENYNMKRLEEVRKETIKGKQFIQIKLTFDRGPSFEQTLPRQFTVTKKWNRDSDLPVVTDNVDSQLQKENRKISTRTKASLTRFLNKHKYIYVPAIKDERLFTKMLAKLQEEVYIKKLGNDSGLVNSMEELAERVSGVTEALSADFLRVTGIESSIETPTNIGRLYQALDIVTKSGDNRIMLRNRGDGIRVRYIPSIINYLVTNSSRTIIWGFEEPENSLEFNMARRMADDFYKVYRKNSQIFVTTHSPAFIDLGRESSSRGFRCFKKGENTAIIDFDNEQDEELLSEELGYAYILQKQYQEYKARETEIKTMHKEIELLKNELLHLQKPVLLTEGKTDAMILNMAWDKLYSNRSCPFDIKSCSLIDSGQELAGCDILATILKGIRHDSEKKVIGLFDNDEAGKKAYKLDSNYIYDVSERYKENRNGRGYALILPGCTGELSKIADLNKLCIEFMFPYEYLKKEVDGKKLEISPPVKTVSIDGCRLEQYDAGDEYWFFGKIKKESKLAFAEFVVPSLEREAFTNFKVLFEIIMDIVLK